MSSEDENYVTVTVKARGREYSLHCRNAVVVTARADGSPGPACHIGDLDRDALPVLADSAVSELLSFGIRAGVPEDRIRIELVHAATSCGYTEEEERGAIRYNLDIDMDESGRKRRMSNEEPKVKVTIERENVEPVEFEVNGLVCAGDVDDGVLVFAGGYMDQRTALGIMRRLVSESVRVMVGLGIDETEARGQVMLAAVSPSDASKLLLDVDLDDRDRIARIAKELAASADF